MALMSLNEKTISREIAFNREGFYVKDMSLNDRQ